MSGLDKLLCRARPASAVAGLRRLEAGIVPDVVPRCCPVTKSSESLVVKSRRLFDEIAFSQLASLAFGGRRYA